MTSRERVLAALNHRQPDCVPVDFGATAVTGMHVSCVAALRERLGLEKGPVKVHEPFQMLGFIDEDLKQALGLDIDGLFPSRTMFGFELSGWKSWRMPQGLEVLVPGAFHTTVAPNGDTLIYPEGDLSAPPSGRMPKDGHFFDAIIRQEPIEDDKLNPEDNCEEFQPISDADVEHFRREAEAVKGSGRAVIASFGGTAFGDIALVPGPGLKRPKGIRDVAEWYMSTRARRDYVHKVFERQCEVGLANLKKLRAAVGGVVDVAFVCGTDFGTQTSAFCSVEAFRELYFPYYRRLNDWIHSATAWKCLKHSCGSVERFIPSLIEAGFDILNPVQCSAANMGPEHLKSAFGDRIVFWGGGVDTQKTLPFGTPAQVRAEVIERLRIFSPGGGFVFNSIHNIQAGTPVENILAMFEAIREFHGVAKNG
jgi:uroporphyrinogen-III decarboxylase